MSENEIKLAINPANPNAFNAFTLDSTRFNNILLNDQVEDRLSDDEIEKYNKELESKLSCSDDTAHKENAPDEVDLGFFTVECPKCGLTYNFKTPLDIPNDDFSCSCCDRLLIHYTGIPDGYFNFDDGSYI